MFCYISRQCQFAFKTTDTLQGSVATHFRSGGILMMALFSPLG